MAATWWLCGKNKHRECGGGSIGWDVADFWTPNGNGNTTGRMNAEEDQPKFLPVSRAVWQQQKKVGKTIETLAQLAV